MTHDAILEWFESRLLSSPPESLTYLIGVPGNFQLLLPEIGEKEKVQYRTHNGETLGLAVMAAREFESR